MIPADKAGYLPGLPPLPAELWPARVRALLECVRAQASQPSHPRRPAGGCGGHGEHRGRLGTVGPVLRGGAVRLSWGAGLGLQASRPPPPCQPAQHRACNTPRCFHPQGLHVETVQCIFAASSLGPSVSWSWQTGRSGLTRLLGCQGAGGSAGHWPGGVLCPSPRIILCRASYCFLVEEGKAGGKTA